MPELERKEVTAFGYTISTGVWRGTGEQRPLLFFNGVGANMELAQPLAENLPDRDVIAFDIPGIGESPAATIPYRPWGVAKMASGILDALGYDCVNVLGVSWGGGAAQQFAFQCPDRVNRLILAATSAGTIMVPGDPKVLMKMANPRRYVDRDYLMKVFKTLYGEDADSHHARNHAINIKPPSNWGYFMQLAAMAGWTSLPFLPFMQKPTLILAGTHDKIVPLANSKILYTAIPNAELKTIEGGHLFIVTHAKEVVPLMDDFLAEAAYQTKAA
jgi:poly(3-hydroxyalkanoate) depolymerase